MAPNRSTPVQDIDGRSAFAAQLRQAAAETYHDKHPFHILLHQGALDKGQLQAWALNRYCFQNAAPQKDAILISRSSERAFRREWTLRLLDHDGFGADEGGLERWLQLTESLGLDRAYVVSQAGALPQTRQIIEMYLEFVRTEPFVAAVATTLTELLSSSLHRERLSAMLASYDFLSSKGLGYFKQRLTHAPRDASFALEYVLAHAATQEQKLRCVAAVKYKCAVLWQMLDALQAAYVDGKPPEGSFSPETWRV